MNQLLPNHQFQLINMYSQSRAQFKRQEAIAYLEADHTRSKIIILELYPFGQHSKITTLSKIESQRL